jgi:hypothetical protein
MPENISDYGDFDMTTDDLERDYRIVEYETDNEGNYAAIWLDLDWNHMLLEVGNFVAQTSHVIKLTPTVRLMLKNRMEIQFT